MRWARMTPETIERLSELEPVQAALVLRGILDHHPAVVKCLGCALVYEVQGDVGGLRREPCPACGGALEAIG